MQKEDLIDVMKKAFLTQNICDNKCSSDIHRKNHAVSHRKRHCTFIRIPNIPFLDEFADDFSFIGKATDKHKLDAC